jgi:signal transduction histidine kinase
MLKRLRWQLTLLYLFSSIILASLIGWGAYSLLNYYFQSANDQALKLKVGLALMEYSLPLPDDLEIVVSNAGFNVSEFSPTTSITNPGLYEIEEDETFEEHRVELESSLADIYILPLLITGDLITGLKTLPPNTAINFDAITSARATGIDFRTVNSLQGIPVRLFTYMIQGQESDQVFQAGRYLLEQQQVLQQLSRTMVIAGGLVTLIMGIASWLMAGRTIKPSQAAWDKQQLFISNASHELRAPLTLIHAGVELSLRKARNPELHGLLTDVLNDSDYMKKLIEDLLLLSRLDADSLKIELQPIRLAEFIPDLTRQLRRLAENQNVAIDESIEPVSVMADPVRLKQVLLIITDNALRNSPCDNSVVIAVTPHGSNVDISVKDHGQGITPDDQEKVFDRFYKADDRSSPEYSGSGLGLSIAKGLIEAQGGNIRLDSSPGNGTTVVITLPSVHESG